MFTNHEALICEHCKTEFPGRKAAEGGNHVCPDCLIKTELSVVNLKKSDEIPSEILEEMCDGRGEDDE